MRKPRRKASAGFTLLSVLVAMIVAGIGLLGIVRAVVSVTGAATQNEFVSSMAALSNAFWGVAQSNPSMLVSTSITGITFTSSNYTLAPSALQGWLLQATQALPGAQITITTGPDAASGSTCSATTGCTVALNIQWAKVASTGSAASTRSQTFYYQFGL